ncbi:MAG TPA: glycosyltransferase family 39 protein, partial [Anaerolineales bacterium]|nr:glycosyltransferase family 39 protein [Anaerolineales bacterium]
MNQKNTILERGIGVWHSLPPSWRFSLVSVTLMRAFYTLWSLVFLSSFSLVVQNQDILGEPLVTVFDLQTSHSYAYSRLLEKDLLLFQKYDAAHLFDTKTGSVWQISDGKAVSGLYEGNSLLPAPVTTEELFPYHGVASHPSPWIAIWQRFDANWYLLIAQNGYGSASGDVHFPPLYPVLIRLISSLIPSGLISALLLSQIALYIAVKLLYDLFTEWENEKVAQKSLFFLLIFPTSFFLFSAYTEALFIVFTLLCLESIRNRKWHWAGFWVFCALLVRLQGVALLLPLAWGILQTRFRNIRFAEVFFTGLS